MRFWHPVVGLATTFCASAIRAQPPCSTPALASQLSRTLAAEWVNAKRPSGRSVSLLRFDLAPLESYMLVEVVSDGTERNRWIWQLNLQPVGVNEGDVLGWAWRPPQVAAGEHRVEVTFSHTGRDRCFRTFRGELRINLQAASATYTGATPTTGTRAPAVARGPVRAQVAVTDAAGWGVPAVRVALDGGATAVLTDSAGLASFPAVQPGAHTVALGFPFGYDTVPGQRLGFTAAGAPVTLTLRARALRSVTRTLRPGRPDTLALANGMAVVALAPAGPPLTVTVRERPPSALPDSLDLAAGLDVTLGAGGQPGLSVDDAVLAGAAGSSAAGSVGLTIWGVVPAGTSEASLTTNVRTQTTPVYLTADATNMTVTMPNGQSRAVALVPVTVPPEPMSQFVGIANVAKPCTQDRGLRQITALDGGVARMAPGDRRRPLILVHGWQMRQVGCGAAWRYTPLATTWKDFAARFGEDADLKAQYRAFAVKYPTFEHIQRNADWLDSLLRVRELDRNAVVVAHSMGGLVTRGVFARRRSSRRPDPIRALVTLATPHEGAPPAVPIFFGGPRTGWGPYQNAAGVRDLQPNSGFINMLRSQTADSARVFAIAGLIGHSNAPGASALRAYGKIVGYDRDFSDGTVPIPSALPSWATLQTRVPGVHHTGMTDGPLVYRLAREVLIGLAIDCGTPPARLAAHDFPLTARVVRVPGTSVVEVVVGPIAVDGRAAVAVEERNVQLVEDGCVRRLTRMTGAPGQATMFNYRSMTRDPAMHDVRVRVEVAVNGRTYRAEVAPGLASK